MKDSATQKLLFLPRSEILYSPLRVVSSSDANIVSPFTNTSNIEFLYEDELSITIYEIFWCIFLF